MRPFYSRKRAALDSFFASFRVSDMPPSSPLDIADLVAFWDFQGETWRDLGPNRLQLKEYGGPLPRREEGVFGPSSVELGSGSWLGMPRGECAALDIHGPDAQLSVVAWVKRRRSSYGGCQAVAGMWNEHGWRQYCLFLNLHIHDSAEQVGAHVSAIGGPTPGEKYCMDAAIGATPIPFDTWSCIAMTYDGHQAAAWLDGRLDHRGARNPYSYPEGIFNGGSTGSDFTVGAVARPEWVDENRRPHGAVTANPYHGLLGGLAVYRRALGAAEFSALALAGHAG